MLETTRTRQRRVIPKAVGLVVDRIWLTNCPNRERVNAMLAGDMKKNEGEGEVVAA